MKPPASPTEEQAIRALYTRLLDAWNRRLAHEFAALFSKDGNVVGFDGSPLNGQAEIEAGLQRIFQDHLTAAYISKVREVRFLSEDVALLRAVAGMIPHGEADLDPAVNSIQSLVATREGRQWHIALFQNTPAQFHGRPEMAVELTKELTAVWKEEL